jgi:hypothetical protein
MDELCIHLYVHVFGRLRGGAWTLFRLLAAMTLGTSSAPAPGFDGVGDDAAATATAAVAAFSSVSTSVSTSSSRSTEEVHQLVFNIIRSELHIGSIALACSSTGIFASSGAFSTGSSGALPTVSRQLECVEVESTMFALLQFLHSVCSSSVTRLFLASADMVKVLLRVYFAGSPRLQRLVLAIIGTLASRLDSCESFA